jgi:hypothetical protein
MIRFDIMTVFPEMFTSPCGFSLLKRALDKGLIDIRLHDIRKQALDKHHMTDDAPYGGGGGMVMKVEPIERTLRSIPLQDERTPIILLTPQGERFCQKMAEELAGFTQLVLICGHYEGVDERVRTQLVNREISIGDYVLTGGELSAMVMVDAVSRLVPGKRRFRRRGYLFHGAFGVSPLHASRGIQRLAGSRGTALGKSQGNRDVEAQRVFAADKKAKTGPPGGSFPDGKRKTLVGRRGRTVSEGVAIKKGRTAVQEGVFSL